MFLTLSLSEVVQGQSLASQEFLFYFILFLFIILCM